MLLSIPIYLIILTPYCNIIDFHSIQMNTSKEQSQIIRKIERLKDETMSAQDYRELEKAQSKLPKLQEAVQATSNRKVRKELAALLDGCQALAKQRTRYFKKRMLEQLQTHPDRPTRSPSNQKTLKYSKSLESFPPFPLPPPSQNDRTQPHPDRIHSLQQQLLCLRSQLTVHRTLTLPSSPDDQLAHRLREKTLQLQQLRGKVRYYEEKNQELRNRLQNEQKRQEDYIAGLKGQAERWEREAEEAGRERRRLQEELGRVYGVCDGFRAEVRGLTAEVDLLQREKKQWQVSEIMKMRDPAVRKELEVLAQQEKYLREVEGLVEAERQEKLNLEQLNQQLQASLARWDSERLALESEKARLTDLLELREEETSQLRKQLLHDAQSLSRSQQSSHQLQAALSLATQELQRLRARRAGELGRKAEGLRQVRAVLESH